MSPTEVEFVFEPLGSVSLDEQLVNDPNPHCNYALRVGDIWIPAENIYMGTLLLTHWCGYLERIHELYHGSEYEFLQGTSGTILLMERTGQGKIRVGDLYDETAITDETERLGIETFVTVSLDTFAHAVVERAVSFLDRLLTLHQDPLGNDRWVKHLRETIKIVESDLQRRNDS